jgi:glycosyltransferase involved in cell wall biosynthesis
MLLSIVVPVFNEEKLVCSMLEKILQMQPGDGIEREIIVVDDGSGDGTRAAIETFIRDKGGSGIHLLAHEHNRGKGAAVRTGFTESRGDILVVQDADLEYDPADIPKLVRALADGREQVVYGSRILMEKALGRSGICGLITGKHPHSYVLAYLGGVAITRWINLLTGARLTDEPTCYKCFHRTALEGIAIECDDFAWEPEITMKLLKRGVSIAEIPISYHPRKREEGKKINWRDGIKALWTAWRYR